MEIVLYTVMAVALYIVSDRVLLWLEARRGSRLPNRSLIFLGIILALAFVSFSVIRRIMGGA